VFYTTVQRGSMARAAQQLGVSQPVVSEVIADLENALGVRLLDRHRYGVEPTKYGNALIKRGTVVFDELKQSVRDIEFLADPAAGEVTFGWTETMGCDNARARSDPAIHRWLDGPDPKLGVGSRGNSNRGSYSGKTRPRLEHVRPGYCASRVKGTTEGTEGGGALVAYGRPALLLFGAEAAG
jgi:Bacterial regulatory helix-turn-helix protein, lysR family